jgi:hypothetical protein
MTRRVSGKLQQLRTTSRNLALVTNPPPPSAHAPQLRKHRGDLDRPHHEGAAFADEDEDRDEDVQTIGLAYQVASVGPIDAVMETFVVLFQLTMLYAIDDEDRNAYEAVQRGVNDAASMQAMFDERKVKRPPPIFELKNARSTEVLHARISSVQRMRGRHEDDEWTWHAQLFFEIRADCYEALE